MFTKIMKILTIVAGSAIFIISCSKTQEIPATFHPDTAGWSNLFESDLSNADFPAGEWVMEDGVLYAEGHGTLWTEEEYEDFILDLEFRVEPGANSGIFFRTKDKENVLSALEVQIHDSTDGSKHGEGGAIYDLISPSTDASKPAGEWQHYTITANENKIYVVLNGTQIIDMDINEWAEPHQNPDGTRHKFNRAIAEQTYGGPIGFQGIHGSAGAKVYFRNLKIKRIGSN